MTLGNDTDIWPLSLHVMKRACWNNYRTCVWQFTLARGHSQLSDGVGWWFGEGGGYSPLDMALHLLGWKVRVQGAKGQHGERVDLGGRGRRDKGRSNLLLARVLIWWGRGAKGLPLSSFWSFGRPAGGLKKTSPNKHWTPTTTFHLFLHALQKSITFCSHHVSCSSVSLLDSFCNNST